MPSRLCHPCKLDVSICHLRGVWCSSLFLFILDRNANNSVDPDWTPHSAASDLGLHCLPRSQIWDPSHKSVKRNGKWEHRLFLMNNFQRLTSTETVGHIKVLWYKVYITVKYQSYNIVGPGR